MYIYIYGQPPPPPPPSPLPPWYPPFFHILPALRYAPPPIESPHPPPPPVEQDGFPFCSVCGTVCAPAKELVWSCSFAIVARAVCVCLNFACDRETVTHTRAHTQTHRQCVCVRMHGDSLSSYIGSPAKKVLCVLVLSPACYHPPSPRGTAWALSFGV